MFTVYDSGRAAQFPDCKVDPSWNNCTFQTLEEAQAYADHWLGYGPCHIQPNSPFSYGDECWIEIKQISPAQGEL